MQLVLLPRRAVALAFACTLLLLARVAGSVPQLAQDGWYASNHGPQALSPTVIPRVYVVQRAGDTQLLGKYLQQPQKVNGAFWFVKIGSDQSQFRISSSLQLSGRLWYIKDDYNGISFYYVIVPNTEDPYPPLVGWKPVFTHGRAPSPVLSIMRGQCRMDGTCTCEPTFYGSQCAIYCNATQFCHGHGSCQHDTGVCGCDQDYSGTNCTSCNGHGTWQGTRCDCVDEFTGPVCSAVLPHALWKFWLYFKPLQYVLASACIIAFIALVACLCCLCCRKTSLCGKCRGRGSESSEALISPVADKRTSSRELSWDPKLLQGLHSSSSGPTQIVEDDAFGESVRAVYQIPHPAKSRRDSRARSSGPRSTDSPRGDRTPSTVGSIRSPLNYGTPGYGSSTITPQRTRSARSEGKTLRYTGVTW